MTVVLVGIGADSGNTNPIAPVHDDGRFEYIPIPETVVDSSETRTYGTESLRFDLGTPFAEYVNWIRPDSYGDRIYSNEQISEHPLHYDPDFTRLTYGESGARSEYVERLVDLEPDVDAVAFYAGLRKNGRKHRYLIGYFVVNEVVRIAGMTNEERELIFRAHPHNAHSKRFFGAGESKHDELVIVDGREPGGLLERADVKMSSYNPFGANQYYLSDDFVRQFPLDDRSYTQDPESDEKRDKVWIGFKKPLEIGMTADEFIEQVRAIGDGQ